MLSLMGENGGNKITYICVCTNKWFLVAVRRVQWLGTSVEDLSKYTFLFWNHMTITY